MEDDDLARAIELSLQDTHREKPEVINVDDDEEEEGEGRFQEDLRKALQASQELHQGQQSAQRIKSSSIGDTVDFNGSTFLSERAKMEKERLERQKRLRPETVTELGTQPDDAFEDEEPPPKRPHLSRSNSTPINSNPPESSKEPLFWHGELRQTATMRAEPRKDGLPTFRLTDVLGKTSELALAIISSYSLDYSWIYSFFDPSVPVILVAQPDASGEASVKIVLPNWIRATPFLRAGYGCQHMKFMLLFYKDGRLRVVISTANLIAYDWRDMENSVWLQDISLRSKPIPHSPKADDFPSVLQRVLHAVNVRPALAAMINDNHPDLPLKTIDDIRQKWDWSNVKAHLVASIAGKHETWPRVIQTGHPHLMSVVRKLGMRTGKSKGAKDIVIECQGSSIGAYTTQWLNEFHWSARGESAEDWLDKPKKSREKLPFPSVKIIFPTKTTVQASAAGEQGGGTIFCRRKQWEAKKFPRDLFYDSKSKAGPVLMHSKMIIAMLQDNPLASKLNLEKEAPEASEDDEIEEVEPGIGWAYIGSHNFTPSAWGTLSGSAFNPVLNISNYELGVVLLITTTKQADHIACFQRPLRRYRTDDLPWMQEESVFHQQQGQI